LFLLISTCTIFNKPVLKYLIDFWSSKCCFRFWAIW
jgi:hypothetical protein